MAGGCPVGVSKSLRSSDHKTGAPSRAQKVQFKRPINPLEYFTSRNPRGFGIFYRQVMKMAKDGTNRGGRRVRAGDKPKPLAEKIAAGEDADIIEFTPTVLEGADLDDAADLVGEEMPSPGEYLSARQKDGKPLGADEIYKETWLWLKNRGCEKLVNKRLLESYSLAFARFIQCEDALSTYGLLGKHPTTGGVVASPFASLSQSYQKQANLLWYEIFDIVKQNCTTKFDGSPQDDLMEQLLRSRK